MDVDRCTVRKKSAKIEMNICWSGGVKVIYRWHFNDIWLSLYAPINKYSLKFKLSPIFFYKCLSQPKSLSWCPPGVFLLISREISTIRNSIRPNILESQTDRPTHTHTHRHICSIYVYISLFLTPLPIPSFRFVNVQKSLKKNGCA